MKSIRLTNALCFVVGLLTLLLPALAGAQSLTGASISPTTLIGGATAVGTVNISPAAPAGGFVVTLTSLHPYVQVPSTVTVSQGATSKQFTITTSTVTSIDAATVEFMAGATTLDASVTLNPKVPVAISSFTLSSNLVVGGYGLTGTVTLNQSAPTSEVVQLSGGAPNVASMPSSLGFPHGALTESFRISTSPATSTHDLTLNAHLIGFATKSASLEITPTSVIGISLQSDSVFAGESTTARLALGNPAPAGGLVVHLNSNNTPLAEVPATILVAAGDSNATFKITTIGTNTSQGVNIDAWTEGGLASITLQVVRNGLAQSDWPNFRGTSGGTGQGPGADPVGSLLWSIPVTSINSTPVLGTADPVTSVVPVYIKSDAMSSGNVTGSISAYNTANGDVLWTFTGQSATSTTSSGSSPVVSADGTVYVGMQDGNMYALNGSTGAMKWSYQANSAIVSSPTVGNDGTVYFGSDHQYVYALHPTTGQLKWYFKTQGDVVSSPALDNSGNVYVGSDDGNLYSLNGQTGAVNWTFSASSPIDSSPAIGSDGTVYVGGTNGLLYAINGQTGMSTWTFFTGGPIFSSPAVSSSGFVYIGSSDGNLYGINATTGILAWSLSMASAVMSPIVVGSDNTVYVMSSGGMVYFVNGTSGSEIGQMPTGVTNFLGSPAISSSGTLYFGFGAIQ